MYATVEEYNRGHATVRLTNHGSRMTNLPVHTATVEEGERVIVDYSAEGQPYVRPLTALPTVADEPIGISYPEPEEENGMIAARISTTGRKPFETYYYFPGIGYDVHKESVPWDKIEWETQEGLVLPEVDGVLHFYAPEDGKYLVKYCIALEQHQDAPLDDGNIQFRVYHKNWNGSYMASMGAYQHRRWVATQSDGVDITVVCGTSICQLAPDTEQGWINTTVDVLVQAECNMPYWYPGDPGYGTGVATAFAYKAGCYPILEVYKIAQTGDSLEANYDHIWWQYW